LSPIGVFDSGVGGLSVLRALHTEMPHESFVYVGDSGHAPYGERDDGHIITRAIAITDYLIKQHDVKALVVACNTATAAAIALLRQRFEHLPIIGIEPALKPASIASITQRVGVLATAGTIGSEKFKALLNSLAGSTEFVVQSCPGLATAIENNDIVNTDLLCKRYVAALGTFGSEKGEIDSLVLGCTHYPFATAVIQRATGTNVRFFDGGVSVAVHTRRVLEKLGQFDNTGAAKQQDVQPIKYLSTGRTALLQSAVSRWFGSDVTVTGLFQV
jgi:glutamate racemase